MSYLARRAKRRAFDVWPGFVDALSSMLMMVVLVLMIMAAAQFYLSSAVVNKDLALGELGEKLRQLAAALSLEKDTSSGIQARSAQLEDEMKRNTAEMTLIRTSLLDKERAFNETQSEREKLAHSLDASELAKGDLAIQLALIGKQVEELNAKLSILTIDLDTTRTKVKEKEHNIEELNKKLNKAYIKKVEELAEYRSEFFGRLKKVLSNRPDIRIVGDRFVFSSEVFFQSAAASLEESGKQELLKFAEALKEMSRAIPKDVDWVLSVVGHTDKLPISNAAFPSNWELSSARAISVVKFLSEAGIPPQRLAAIGYGEYQPLDSGASSEAFAKNRRIEVKLDQK